MPDFITPPEHICILRLSAIGDICHTLPLVRTIQKHWPETRLTWVIGKSEYALLEGIDDIHFIVFDKKNGLKEYLKVRQQLKNIKFDALLHMQMALRASIISLFIKAKRKIGFDNKRAKDAQWLFTNQKINPHHDEHVMDSLFGFAEALGINEHHNLWNIPVSHEQRLSALNLLNGLTRYVVISPCSSKAYRNWNIEGYVAICDYLKEKHNYSVVLTGGNSEVEKIYGTKIYELSQHKPLNLIGKTNLKQLLTILEGADFLISPDSGPAHIATTVQTPVIGLYATTNPDRARPYLSKTWTVNRYPDAIYKKFNLDVSSVAWGTRVRDDWAMNLITINDVTTMIDKIVTTLSDKN